MKRIEAVIFDWAGTTVDYGCMAPVQAMMQAFGQQNIAVTLDEIREPMGMLKLDHIKAVMAMDRVHTLFMQTYGKTYSEQDIKTIYQQFEKNIFEVLSEHGNVVPGVLSVLAHLREQHIKIGSTTGYTEVMMAIVAEKAAENGYQPDCIVCADQVSHARPYPFMLQQNMMRMQVRDVRTVVKVGDTIIDILEGLHAGCWSVGVILGSSMLGLQEHEVAQMSPQLLQQKMQQVKYEMLSAGAHFVIDRIDELPFVIQTINRLAN